MPTGSVAANDDRPPRHPPNRRRSDRGFSSIPERPTPELLRALLVSFDEKHDAAHDRLRDDHNRGFDDVNEELKTLTRAQASDHDLLVAFGITKTEKKELSAMRAVLIASCVSGLFTLGAAAIEAWGGK